MSSPKIGRPKSENPKSKRLSVKLTDNEFKYIDECSKKLNMTKSEMVFKGIELLIKQKKD
ncbi:MULTISPECIES: hypothetical protein [unclassified Gemella]|uniref:hypothetical protein n=1 Tax=unclassified Gemella TaxID=2624949 RepID=UPI0015D07F68|nr:MULTISPECIES: hypothetical protein [unclassified Gemella]MBF0709713.1 hypothetical protein [Gemella sp. GL1.1]NYS27057.1 hypothetical protein [Gemella sp. GL1]